MTCKIVGTPTHNDVLCDSLKDAVKNNSKANTTAPDDLNPVDCYACVSKSDLIFDSFCDSVSNKQFQISMSENNQQCIKDNKVGECTICEAKAYSSQDQDLGSIYASYTSTLCLCPGGPTS